MIIAIMIVCVLPLRFKMLYRKVCANSVDREQSSPEWATLYELRHDKTIKMAVRPAKTQFSLGIRPV